MFRKQPCAVCAAKDQTIALLADLVDWHRAQAGAPLQAFTPLQPAPISDVSPPGAPVWSGEPSDLWVTDEEEDILDAIKSGVMEGDQAERALAYIQAQNTPIKLVR